MASSQLGPRKKAKTGRESDISSKTRKTSAYDPEFEQHLIDHGIHMNSRAQKPSNWEEINRRITQPRPSLSPSRFSETAFETFEQTNDKASTEATVMSKAFPIIAGTSDIPSQENLLFGNLKPLTDNSITKAKPDFYDGSCPTKLNKQIREELGPYIVPSTNTATPCLPNFFTEGKGPSGNPAVCKRQALYDGALGARGVHKLRSYVNPETAYDNNAYTITSTYHGSSGDLTIYSTHPTPSNDPQNPIEYRMTQLRGWKMTDTPETFRQGASALRNARDWAKEKREELIIAANGKVSDAEHPESETSADELTLDPNTLTSFSHRTPVRAQASLPPKVSSDRRSKKASVSKKPSRRPEAEEMHRQELALTGTVLGKERLETLTSV